MSVKDLIWVHVCQYLKAKQNLELEKARNKNLEQFYLAIADIRTILNNSNWFMRIAALKDTGIKKIEPLDRSTLPSVAVAKERELEERCAGMTPEERELYIFNHGGRVRH